MRYNLRAVVGALAAALAASSIAAHGQGAPAPQRPAPATFVFRARGVYYFPGSVRCPLAGVGSRGPYESNRLALDDDYSRAVIDRTAHRIVFSNLHRYPTRQQVGDVIFLGRGATEAGMKAPVAVHLNIAKTGNTFDARAHVHPTVRDRMVSAEIDPYEVVVSNGRSEIVVLNEAATRQAVRDRLAAMVLEVQDNLEGVTQDVNRPGYRRADISIGLGEGKLSKMILRAQLVSLDGANANIIRRRALAEMFRAGAWELRQTALSSLLPRDSFRRDLFLLGLDRVPELRRLRDEGLKNGETFSFLMRDGKATLTHGQRRLELENSADVSRAYLEFNFIGAILARQVTDPLHPPK